MKKLIKLIILILVIWFGYKLISPAFITKTVDEALPEELTPIVEKLMEQATPEMKDKFMEEMKEIATKVVEVAETMNEPKADSEEEPKQATGPQLIGSGNFTDVAHHGRGLAKLFAFEDGNALIRLQDLDVLNGPDLRVLLSKSENVQSSDDLGEYVEFGKLKGNKGNQNYELTLEGDTDISEYRSVVIYCKPFSVVFNSASLQ